MTTHFPISGIRHLSISGPALAEGLVRASVRSENGPVEEIGRTEKCTPTLIVRGKLKDEDERSNSHLHLA